MLNLTPFLKAYAGWRLRALARLDPAAAQERTLLRLTARARDTRFGRAHGYGAIRNVADFQARVPLRRYEDFWREYWSGAFPHLAGVTWPGTVPYFALTSGTTSGSTKYIPLTREMRRSNVRAGLDVLCHHVRARPHTQFFGGKSFMLGGSTALREEAPGIHSGDLSGIATLTLPAYAAPYAFPDAKTALLSDWEEKIAILAERALDEDIRALTGTPSWVLILLERVRALRRARGDEGPLFPRLELFIHGGVNFAPYRHRFQTLFAGQNIDQREVYPASEGFIAHADRGWGEGLLLHLDHGLFFEFVPIEELNAPSPTRHWVGTIETGINYAVVMTTCAGLHAYVIGDTVRFIGLDPPRLLITGRTSYGLSAFGEHLIAEEIETAVAEAAEALGLDVTDYSLGAEYPGPGRATGGHLYICEFAAGIPPEATLTRFAALIDAALARLNEDYAAHRGGGFGMDAPQVLALPPGSFAHWMKARGKLGGQHKVARIINDPALWADLKAFAARAQ
ncbi:MAG: GH3 auxin-responsive promoter family protein [Alphaproteobacteria bacterium]|nr:GH3 auxin-responsive promoter family protein [Alphaproteobacteria bacterium]